MFLEFTPLCPVYLVAKEELALVGSIEPGLIQAQVGIAGSDQVKHLLSLKQTVQ